MKRNYLLGLMALAIAMMGASSSTPTNNGSDSATVKGGVKLEGALPTPTRINMSSDVACARQHNTAALSEEIVAAKNGDLQNVVVFVAEGLGDRTFEVPAEAAVSATERLRV